MTFPHFPFHSFQQFGILALTYAAKKSSSFIEVYPYKSLLADYGSLKMQKNCQGEFFRPICLLILSSGEKVTELGLAIRPLIGHI